MYQACKLLILIMVAATTGCVAMCDSSMDYNYAAYGGVRDRVDREQGRVASLFDPAASLDDVMLTTADPVDPRSLDPDADATEDDDDLDDSEFDEEKFNKELLEKLRDLSPELPEVPQIPDVNGDEV